MLGKEVKAFAVIERFKLLFAGVKEHEKEEGVRVQAAARQQGYRSRFVWSQEHVSFCIHAKRSVACRGNCLKSDAKRSGSPEQAALAWNETDMWFARHCSGSPMVHLCSLSRLRLNSPVTRLVLTLVVTRFGVDFPPQLLNLAETLGNVEDDYVHIFVADVVKSFDTVDGRGETKRERGRRAEGRDLRLCPP